MSDAPVILVSGAAGFIGRHVLRAASSDTARRWVGVGRVAPDRSWDTPPHFRFMNCDLSDVAQCTRLIREVRPNSVLHLAGYTARNNSQAERDQIFRANVILTCNLLEGVRLAHAGTPHFVLASSGLVYGDQPSPFKESVSPIPLGPYPLSKVLAEEAVLSFARAELVRACIVRTAVVYGGGQAPGMFVSDLLQALREGRRFSMSGGRQTRDFIFIEDIAKALLLVVQRGLEGTYNAGSGHGTHLRNVAETAARLLRCPELLGIGELPYNDREVWSYELDTSRLHALGWRAEVPLEEGLCRTLEWRP